MTELDIAVVIVTYKSAALTIESLRSVSAERTETGFNVRVVVIDNASGDTPAVADAIDSNSWHSWVTLVTAPKNGGFAYGNNIGISAVYKKSVPAYIYLLNPDAQVRPDGIKSLARFMETHPAVGIAGSSFENLDGSDWPIAFRFPTMMSELISGIELGPLMRLFRRWNVPQLMTKQAQPIDWICGASMLIRPAVLDSIRGLDENYFLYFEETDFCYRAKLAGFPTWYVPQSRVMHIRGQSTAVTDLTGGPKRLPPYWFESRRRYFAVTYGVGRAVAIDIISLIACSIGVVTRAALRRSGTATPCFIRDLFHHSIIWRRNREIPAARFGDGHS